MNPSLYRYMAMRHNSLARTASTAIHSSTRYTTISAAATTANGVHHHAYAHSYACARESNHDNGALPRHELQKRYLSNSPKTEATGKVSFKDNRIAGRRRFYKQVGVKSVEAPWDDDSVRTMGLHIDSPISAGVDGTQSATGVTRALATKKNKKDRLMPRKPGSDSKPAEVDWYTVTLDGGIVKTPLGQTLAVPSQILAWAIAAEWDAQEEYLQPAQMPLMTLACTALDQTASTPQIAQENSLVYLPTDTICYWSDPSEDRVLNRRQLEAWKGIHDHCETMFGDRAAAAMGANEGLLMSRVRGSKSIGLPHPESLTDGADHFVKSLDAWHLTALASVSREAKSLLVGMALLSDGVSPKKAAEAARVEEEFQISIWGLVEGGHDYDRLNCSIQVHAAHVLASAIAIDNGL